MIAQTGLIHNIKFVWFIFWVELELSLKIKLDGIKLKNYRVKRLVYETWEYLQQYAGIAELRSESLNSYQF